MERKTIRVELTVESGLDDFTVCEAIEAALMQSPLNNSEHKMEITETKVTKHESE